MNINDVVADHLGTEGGGSLLHSANGQRLYDRIRSESRTEPLMASLFWQIVTYSPSFAQALRRVGASPLAFTQAERFIICNGPEYNARYDLVVFDPQFDRDEPASISMNELMAGNEDKLTEDFGRWREQHRSTLASSTSTYSWEVAGTILDVLRLVDQYFIQESLLNKPFGLLVARPPTIKTTGVPSPPLGVSPLPGSLPSSTAGALVRNAYGDGVTVALHDLTNTLPSVISGQTQIWVETLPGLVQSVDLITDSAFVTVPGILPFQSVRSGLAGPLSGVSPRANEGATFEGISSGKKTVTVTGWSPDLPFVSRFNQLKILTTAETDPGDSGAALVDRDDHILGFAFYRTGLGQAIEFSAWIWADSVFAAHGLTII